MRNGTVLCWMVASMLAIGALAAPARAADAAGGSRNGEPSMSDNRPWAAGVSQADRAAALKLFHEGNQLLKGSFFAQAADKYREALKHWDHPAIHYNLVLALLTLDRPVEVYRNLEAAVKYGAAPIDPDRYKQAKIYLSLIGKQVAKLSIRCDVKGAKVVMDGHALFVGPGSYQGLVRVGPHTVVATADGYLTNEITRSFPAGKETNIDLRLFQSSDLTQYRRKFSQWIPWTVAASGVLVAAVGGLMQAQAHGDFGAFDRGVVACGGCVPSASVEKKLSAGHTMQSLAITGYAVGGAALATGLVLLYVNRKRAYRVTQSELNADTVSIAPMLGPGEKGLVAEIRF